MQDWAGRTAFVTGAGNGIGRAIAESLARAGVAVAVADIDADAAIEAAASIEKEGGRALGVGCDVTDGESLRAAAEAVEAHFGPVHILVNNAGAFTAGPIEQTSPADWEWLLDVNVMGVVRGIDVFLPRMRAHGEPAHIVNTASVSGHIAVAGLGIYTATKFAVVGLSECLRKELADTPIGVSVLCPGIVKTGLLESSVRHRHERHGRADAAMAGAMAGVVDTGSDPSLVGDHVVEGLRRGDFYLFTHPPLRPAFEARFQEILGAYDS